MLFLVSSSSFGKKMALQRLFGSENGFVDINSAPTRGVSEGFYLSPSLTPRVSNVVVVDECNTKRMPTLR
jgi:hypothetical protein